MISSDLFYKHEILRIYHLTSSKLYVTKQYNHMTHHIVHNISNTSLFSSCLYTRLLYNKLCNQMLTR